MFVAWTPIADSWFKLPDLILYLWLLFAAGAIFCANAACTAWALLLLPAPLGVWYVDCPTAHASRGSQAMQPTGAPSAGRTWRTSCYRR